MRKVLLLLSFAGLYSITTPGCKSNPAPDTTTATKLETKEDDESSEIKDYLAYEFNMLKNPETGKIPANIREQELAQARTLSLKNAENFRISANSYIFQGPNNLGGRTRAIAFDVRYNGTTNATVLAGGISGGVWKSIDGGSTWVRKTPQNVHYGCTSIAQDPRLGFQDTWYYTTGEGLGNSAAEVGAYYGGAGVFKSIDNGETWNRLTTSNTTGEPFNSVNDIMMKVVVNPVNGYVFAGFLAGIKRSTDGGSTWTDVLTGAGANSTQVTDLSVTSTGRVYAGFSGACPNTVDGLWTSTSGDVGSWVRIAGTGVVTNPPNWDAQGSYGRVISAVSPSDENSVYVMYSKSTASSCTGTPAPEAKFFRYNQSENTWLDLSLNLPDEPGCTDGNDPFAVQGGYDMVIAIHPTNPNLVLIGGTNGYRSTDGFLTNTNTTRIAGYASTTGFSQYANSHPDIHAFAFIPGAATPNALLCGNDGGIQRSNDITASPVVWTISSTGFRTYQYNYVTMDPRAGNNKVIGGAQDNGTTRNIGGTGDNFESVIFGDGGSVGLSDLVGGVQYEYVSSQNGTAYRRASTLSPGFINASLKPASTTSNGLFVTLFHLDPDNTEKLYYVNNDTIYRTASASTVTSTTWGKLTGVADLVTGNITALTTTRGSYTGFSSLFFGNNASKVYRLSDPSNVDLTTPPVEISGLNFPANAFVSSISVNPRNDDTALVTFSNYGVVSVFWTGNAKSATPTWVAVEGALTIPSYRSSSIVVVNGNVEYFVGTSAGLYKASIDGQNPALTNWVQEGADAIGNAIVRDLKLRLRDNALLVGTHGYGMWKTVLDPSTLPVTISGFSGSAERSLNTLTWTVQNEVNSKGYQLERKYNGETQFTPVGYVTSKGDGNNISAIYGYKDLNPDLSISQTFYRLKQEDKDGHSKYSTVVNIVRKSSANLVEYISANKNELLIRLNNIAGEKLSIRVLDMQGRQLIKRDVNNSTTQHIAIASLPSGAYLTEILMGSNRAYIQKFVK